jgi:hypothetical protein
MHRSRLRLLAALSLLLPLSCASHDPRANPGWAEGRARAEIEFANGTAETILGCGTIAPGECSSVEQELYEQAFAGGYNERLDELEAAAREPR